MMKYLYNRSIQRLVFLAFGLIVLCTAARAQGPDAFGYTWTQYRAAQGAKWIEIIQQVKNGGLTVDLTPKVKQTRTIGPINFSFDFPYYWYTHNAFYINGSGYVSFQPNNLGGGPYATIPTEAGQGDDLIAAFMTALNYVNNDSAKLYFYSDFKDTVIVTYEDVPFNSLNGPPLGANTFQIILSKSDSSITFQYARQEGSPNQTGCPGTTTNGICLLVGIENNTGKVGLRHSSNDVTPFIGVSKTDPLAIKYKITHATIQNYTFKDMIASWNTNSENGGIFVPKDSPPFPLVTNIKNQGTVPSPSLAVKGTIMQGATALATFNKPLGPLDPNKSVILDMNKNFPTGTTGIHSFNTEVLYTDDMAANNNKIQQLIFVVDTTAPVTLLDYSGGDTQTAFSFLNEQLYERGIGVYIEPPYYPAIIETVKAGLRGFNTPQPSVPVRMQIFDDNGKNIFGFKDGSPGKKLYEVDLLPGVDFVTGYNTFPVDSLIQINSGGVYVTILQGGQNVAYDLKNTLPVSYRTYEIYGYESFNIYRNRKSEDFRLGIEVSKGAVNTVFDLELAELVQPTDSVPVTDSAEVKIRLRNVGPQPVSGPFDVAFRADQRAEVIEEVPASVTIGIGQDYAYTFKQKVSRPLPPRTQFEKFCVRVSLNNDFDLTNDTLCYQTKVGLEPPSLPDGYAIYPNPADQTLFIKLKAGAAAPSQIRLINLLGQELPLIRQESAPGTWQFDLSKVQPGIYFISVDDRNGRRALRISKQ